MTLPSAASIYRRCLIGLLMRRDARGASARECPGIVELQRGEPRIQPATSDQLGMAAFAQNAALIHDNDALQALDGGEPVRDYDGGAPAHQIGQSLLHQP